MLTKRVRTMVRLCLLSFLTFIFVMSVAPTAEALPGPCSLLPEPAKTICQNTVPGGGGPAIPNIPGIQSPVAKVINKASGAAANAIVKPIITEFTSFEVDAMGALLKGQAAVISQTTKPNLTTSWFIGLFALIAGGAVVLGAGMLLPPLVESAKEGDPEPIGSAAFTFVVFFCFVGFLPFLVAVLVAIFDNFAAPRTMELAATELKINLTSTLDFTKPMTLGNNIIAPLLVPFFAGLLGFVGGFFTWMLFGVRELVLYVLVIAEAYAWAMTVSRRWGGDMLVKTSMALGAWILLKWFMAILMVITFGMISSGDASTMTQGMFALIGMPILLWLFIKAMASHRVSVAGGMYNAKAAWDAVPFTPTFA
jgi:hypothetical protein